MKFAVHATDGAARAGTLQLAHGSVETPVFMPVGTYGAVKAVSPAELAENGTRIVLGNTFHLWLRPGLEVIAAHGGLHRFIGWTGPILTDSGGYQVYSLGELRKITEEGVRFASPVNGDRLMLTPAESMRIQRVQERSSGDAIRRPTLKSRGIFRPGIAADDVVSASAGIIGIVDAKLSVIEKVKCFRAELHGLLLRDSEGLEDRQIEVQAVWII